MFDARRRCRPSKRSGDLRGQVKGGTSRTDQNSASNRYWYRTRRSPTLDVVTNEATVRNIRLGHSPLCDTRGGSVVVVTGFVVS